jgi:23S rRNA pseudouridine2605 synthase
MNEKGKSGRKSGEKRPRISRGLSDKKDVSARKSSRSDGRGGDAPYRDNNGPSRGKEGGYKSAQGRDDRAPKREYRKDDTSGSGERDVRRSSAPERGGRYGDRQREESGFKPYGASRDDRGPKREYRKDDSTGSGERDVRRSSAPERGGRYGDRPREEGSFKPYGAGRDDRGPKREYRKDDSAGSGERDARRSSAPERGGRYGDRPREESGFKPYGASRDDRGPKREYRKDDSTGSGERDARRSSAPERGGRFGDRPREEGSFKPYGASRDDRGPKREYRKDDSTGSGERDARRSSAPERGGRYGDRPREEGSFKPYGAGRDDRGPKREYRKDSERDGGAKPAGRTFSKTGGKYSKGEKEAPPVPIMKDIIRLNKYLADAGICSRREADKLIQAGTVTVNGEIVTELGTKVSIFDKVIYGGQALKREKLRYVLLNKPKGYITTSDDPFDRKTVMELVANACEERIYPVGRLDRNTLGLLLLTNDGDLAKRLTHPKHGVKKLYHVELDKPLTKNDLLRIADGLELEDGLIQVDAVSYVEAAESKKEIGIQIHSGKNHIVRRIFEHLGYKVEKLDRVDFANLTKYNLPRGRWRHLTPQEITLLQRIK